MVKGDGGAKGSSANAVDDSQPGPKMIEMLHEYDKKRYKAKIDLKRHHEQKSSVQKRFASHINSITAVLEEIGNPFLIQAKICMHLSPKS